MTTDLGPLYLVRLFPKRYFGLYSDSCAQLETNCNFREIDYPLLKLSIPRLSSCAKVFQRYPELRILAASLIQVFACARSEGL
jgi:hypothetical protein